MNVFDVRVYAIRRRTDRRRPFEVRWHAAGRARSRSFITRRLADSYRAELVRAARQGVEFDPASGEPALWGTPPASNTTWHQLAVGYVDMKWPHVAPHSRASLAEALATLTPVLTRPTARRPPIRTLRAALYRHAFNPHQRNTTVDPATASALAWLERASLPVQRLCDPRVIRQAPDALAVRLDGQPAAANTIARKRAVFHNALGYAAELGLLPANPLGQVGWKGPAADGMVNPLTVASPAQVHAILANVAKMRPELTAFFACLYYAALRPEEAVALRSRDLVLPARGWGKLILTGACPAPDLPGPAPVRPTNRAVSSTAQTARSGSSRSHRSWPRRCASTCATMGPRPMGGCSAAAAAACSANRCTAVPGTPPATTRSALTWPLPH